MFRDKCTGTHTFCCFYFIIFQWQYRLAMSLWVNSKNSFTYPAFKPCSNFFCFVDVFGKFLDKHVIVKFYLSFLTSVSYHKTKRISLIEKFSTEEIPNENLTMGFHNWNFQFSFKRKYLLQYVAYFFNGCFQASLAKIQHVWRQGQQFASMPFLFVLHCIV